MSSDTPCTDAAPRQYSAALESRLARVQNEKMRAEFEAWAKTDGANGLFDRSYRGWQAAYARGYVAGLKRAAEICETIPPKVDQGTSRWRQSDRLDCAAAIRAEIEE